MPGAGKGDNGEHLGKRSNMTHISTGELFRALDTNSALGKEVQEISAAGGLISDDIVNRMVEDKLSPEKNIVLDGYPRSVPQAEWLLEKVKDMPFEVVAILLEISEEIATRRRDNRIAETLASGGVPRKDDLDSSVLSKRFAEYYEKTAPMVDFLRQKLGDKFYSIDASVPVEEVYAAVEKVLDQTD
jgi:adenylate kinase